MEKEIQISSIAFIKLLASVADQGKIYFTPSELKKMIDQISQQIIGE